MSAELLGPPVVAFAVGALLAFLGFWFSGRWEFIQTCRSAWIYLAVQGVIGAVGYLLLGYLTEQGIVKVPDQVTKSPYLQAIIMGLLAKSISYVTLFDGGASGKEMTIGFKTIVDGLDEKVNEDEKIAIIEYLSTKERKYHSLDEVKDTIKRWVPHKFEDKKDLDAFLGDLENQTSVYDAMLQFLREVGKKMFDRAFPNGK